MNIMIDVTLSVSCTVFDCKMTDLYSPQNGEFTLASGTTTFGSTATFKCNNKYQLSGVSTRTCGLNGWSDDNPTCGKGSYTIHTYSLGSCYVYGQFCKLFNGARMSSMSSK